VLDRPATNCWFDYRARVGAASRCVNMIRRGTIGYDAQLQQAATLERGLIIADSAPESATVAGRDRAGGPRSTRTSEPQAERGSPRGAIRTDARDRPCCANAASHRRNCTEPCSKPAGARRYPMRRPECVRIERGPPPPTESSSTKGRDPARRPASTSAPFLVRKRAATSARETVRPAPLSRAGPTGSFADCAPRPR